jgi:uncharacterized RDD family membrane protein YckC
MADDQPTEAGQVDATDGRIGFGRRLGAFAIDLIVIWILTSIAEFVTGVKGSADPSSLHHLSDLTRLMAGVGVVVSSVQLLYCLIEGLTGASPGKMILKIQIRDASGAPAATGTLILRMVLKQVKVVATFLVALTGSQLLTVVGLAGGVIVAIGCILALGAARQALHDRIVHTAVYRAASLA